MSATVGLASANEWLKPENVEVVYVNKPEHGTSMRPHARSWKTEAHRPKSFSRVR